MSANARQPVSSRIDSIWDLYQPLVGFYFVAFVVVRLAIDGGVRSSDGGLIAGVGACSAVAIVLALRDLPKNEAGRDGLTVAAGVAGVLVAIIETLFT